tara:strand:- start:113 stop:463 length:351 start_codon:yes stop_codon:yes gene_type:complete
MENFIREDEFLFNMPVINGCLDNRDMLKIKCDKCHKNLTTNEMVMCTLLGEDFHVECAERHFEDKAELVKMRKIPYSQRMEEYMQERFKNGEAQKDLETVVLALNKAFPDSALPLP